MRVCKLSRIEEYCPRMHWYEIQVLTLFVKLLIDASHHLLQLLFSLRSFLHLEIWFCSSLLHGQFNISIWMSIRHLIHIMANPWFLLSPLSTCFSWWPTHLSEWHLHAWMKNLKVNLDSSCLSFMKSENRSWELLLQNISRTRPFLTTLPIYQFQPSESYCPISFGSL